MEVDEKLDPAPVGVELGTLAADSVPGDLLGGELIVVTEGVKPHYGHGCL